MKLYNTLTRKTEELKPLNPPTVAVYTCGPTVYDYAHIGHWFTYVRWDMLIRTLKASGFKPKWVMNITDVGHLVSDADEGEDKLERGARREGKSAWDVAKFYTDDFVQGMKQLNMLEPDFMPRATQHIEEQIGMIKKLEEKGYTYVTSDGVYYDTSKFPTYADFARLDLEEQIEGARVEANPEKRNPTDFALWKFSPKDRKRDMEWDSPWGKGFPGWHIECSAMSMKYLGQTLDIHTGGIDHIAVHHSNEIAQSEAVTGKPFANMWLHSNHVLVDGQKISKSLGNGIRIEEVVQKGYDPLVLRLHILESHYRSQSKFSFESLEAARNRLHSYQRMADLQFQPVETGMWFAADQSLVAILNALQDDMNTPTALAMLSELSGRTEEKLINGAELTQFKDALKQLDDMFGLNLSKRKDITGEQKALVAERQNARSAKDWTKSDEIRRQLAEQGIAVRDTPCGPIWHRI
jgi:cysteinyl-tRNA synthetase